MQNREKSNKLVFNWVLDGILFNKFWVESLKDLELVLKLSWSGLFGFFSLGLFFRSSQWEALGRTVFLSFLLSCNSICAALRLLRSLLLLLLLNPLSKCLVFSFSSGSISQSSCFSLCSYDLISLFLVFSCLLFSLPLLLSKVFLPNFLLFNKFSFLFCSNLCESGFSHPPRLSDLFIFQSSNFSLLLSFSLLLLFQLLSLDPLLIVKSFFLLSLLLSLALNLIDLDSVLLFLKTALDFGLSVSLFLLFTFLIIERSLLLSRGSINNWLGIS